MSYSNSSLNAYSSCQMKYKLNLIKEITNEELKNECRNYVFIKSEDNEKLFEILSKNVIIYLSAM